MGDGNDRDAELFVQPTNGFHHFFPSDARSQHGGSLIQNQAIGTHGNYARNGYTLLLFPPLSLCGALCLCLAMPAISISRRAGLRISSGWNTQIFQRKRNASSTVATIWLSVWNMPTFSANIVQVGGDHHCLSAVTVPASGSKIALKCLETVLFTAAGFPQAAAQQIRLF